MCDADIHPMDCTDIIIGSARNTFGQVQDSYTRDRSTPQADSFYGGDDNLIAAVAYEEDGVTTMRFKRALAGETALNLPAHFYRVSVLGIWTGSTASLRLAISGHAAAVHLYGLVCKSSFEVSVL